MLRKCKPISARPNEQKKRKRKKQKATTTNENKWHPVNCCSIGNYIDSVSMCDGNERATEKSTLTNKWNILSYVMIICLDAAYRMIFFVVVADCDSSTEWPGMRWEFHETYPKFISIDRQMELFGSENTCFRYVFVSMPSFVTASPIFLIGLFDFLSVLCSVFPFPFCFLLSDWPINAYYYQLSHVRLQNQNANGETATLLLCSNDTRLSTQWVYQSSICR